VLGWWITLCVLAVRLRKTAPSGGSANLWRQSVVDARFSIAADPSAKTSSFLNRKKHAATEMQQFPKTTERNAFGEINSHRDPFNNPGESV
jgi:hypothetical protein